MIQDPLFSASLLGAARLTNLPPCPDPALADSWAKLSLENPAETLLHGLALTRALRHAGAVPSAAEPPSEPLASPEEKPTLPPAATGIIVRLLTGDAPELLPEALMLACQSGGILPGRGLPDLFRAARKNVELRPAARSLAGNRGLWIARRYPEHAWLLADAPAADNAWDDGLPAERLAWLRQIRGNDPDRAMSAITSQWAGEEPAMRESILRVIAESPRSEDAAWLEQAALKDRRQDIRDLAAAILVTLPGSAFRERAEAALRPCVRAGRKLLSRFIEIEPPATFDPGWAKDGLKEKPPQGMGERAWWLRQLIGRIPLSSWPEILGLKESELFTTALDKDWRDTVLLGWIDSACRFPGRSLPSRLIPLLATLKTWPAQAGISQHQLLHHLFSAMGAAERIPLLESICGDLSSPLALDLFAAWPPSPGTGGKVMALLDAELAATPATLTRPQARQLATCIPAGEIQATLERLSRLPALTAAAEEFATTLEIRRSLHSHFTPPFTP